MDIKLIIFPTADQPNGWIIWAVIMIASLIIGIFYYGIKEEREFKKLPPIGALEDIEVSFEWLPSEQRLYAKLFMKKLIKPRNLKRNEENNIKRFANTAINRALLRLPKLRRPKRIDVVKK